jgi:hypothetical protein
MGFDEAHPSPETISPTILSTSGNARYKWRSCILLILGYKPVQHIIVLNTVGNCNTMIL